MTFSIQRGESVSMIGRNGAGKSTLLSIIAGVYQPNKGRCVVRGRVAPLLELGAGFHPEMTGLENLTLNGMFLGLTKAKILEKRDSIIAFSELDEYIDQPIRKYSSGMIARLGFSLVAHVDAEILIVDEVLSVGDFKFREKCQGFLNEFKLAGGTLLFVSHDAGASERNSERSIWLKDGTIRMDGLTEDVGAAYLLEE